MTLVRDLGHTVHEPRAGGTGAGGAATDPRRRARRDGSFLDSVDEAVRDRLVARSRPWLVGPGEVIFPAAGSWRRVGVVHDGVARALLASGSGRQVTIRYVRPGEMIGNVVPIAGDRSPLVVAAVTACSGLEFDAADFFDIVRTDGEVAALVLAILSRRLEDTYATLAATAFGSLRERIAAHLLDLGQVDGATGRMSVSITQQQLADSVGTVREVAARVLRDLRAEGIVDTAAGRLEILDATGLASEVGRWRAPGRSAEPDGSVRGEPAVLVER